MCASCGVVQYVDKEEVKTEQIVRYISCDVDGKWLYFPIYNTGNALVPFASYIVFWEEMTEDDLSSYYKKEKPRNPVEVSEADLNKWNRLCDKVALRFMGRGIEKVFTIPGIISAYISDSVSVAHKRPKSDLFVYCFPETQRVIKEEVPCRDIFIEYGDMDNDLSYERLITNKKNHGGVVYRAVRSAGRYVVVIDDLYLDNGKMLRLVYPLDGQIHYTGTSETGFKYLFSYSFNPYWKGKNWLMISQYIRQYCDQMTFEIYRAKYKK